MNASFLDSNVLVYLFDADPTEPKRKAAQELLTDGLEGKAVISFQVVQEVLNVLMRGETPGATPDEATEILRDILVPLWEVEPSTALYARALSIRGRYQYSFYDSLIIAAALEAGCTRLYSEELQHGQRIERLTIVNPSA
ncbi:MAG: PIN domain-containing protein [Dehalococcoidia bacterium]